MLIRRMFLAFLFSGLSLIRALGNEPPSPFKITTKRTTDQIAILQKEKQVRFQVKSPTGISQATIERQSENWPETVVIEMHLKGLEHFQISNEKATIQAAVSNQGEPNPVRVWLNQKEDRPLDKNHPLWMEIRRMTPKDQKGDTGEVFFQMELPREFLKQQPSTIALEWVDFYRN